MRLIQIIIACTLLLPLLFSVNVPAEKQNIFADDVFVDNSIQQSPESGCFSNNFFLWCYVETINYGNFSDLENDSGHCFGIGYFCNFGQEDKTTFFTQKNGEVLFTHEGKHSINYFVFVGKEEVFDDKIMLSGYGFGVFFINA